MLEKPFDLYRPCVGICLLNKNKEVFIAHRRIVDPYNETIAFLSCFENPAQNKENDFLWQMPQGGIDAGEDIEETARRELYEETGIKTIEIVKVSRDWYFYDLPEAISQKSWNGKYKGQRQKWILAHFLGDEKEINLNIHPEAIEFDAWRWISPPVLPNIVVPFKRKVYEGLLKEFF